MSESRVHGGAVTDAAGADVAAGLALGFGVEVDEAELVGFGVG